MKRKELTQKQEQFCIEYCRTGDGVASYRKVYNPKASPTVATAGATRLRKLPRVQERLRELNKRVEDEAIADIKELETRLTAILRQEAEEEVLMTEGVDKGVTETRRYKKKADLRTVAKAIELLAKMKGAFSDANQTVVGVQVCINDDLQE